MVQNPVETYRKGPVLYGNLLGFATGVAAACALACKVAG